VTELSVTPFPYFLKEEEIVDEIVSFAKTHEKWPITNIGYVSRFHFSHNSNPHSDMTTYSHQQSVLQGRNRSLERDLEQLKKISVGKMDVKTGQMDRLVESVEWLEKEISEWNSKVIVSDEQLGQCRSIYTRTRIKAEEKIDSLLDEIIERQKKEIIHHSRELSNASSAIGKKSVSRAQVRDYVNKLSTPLIVPDSRNVLYARANFVMKGLRE
jgi:hypothetical protein